MRGLRELLAAGLLALLASGCAGDGVLAPPAAPPSAGAAAQQLDELKVAPHRPMRGYSRDRFPHWSSQGEGCSTREVVLKRDGEGVVVDEDCAPVQGRWHSPYDEVTLHDPSEVDIDHVVPLANAWRSGADEWTDERREAFANDLEHPQLLAVSRSSNRAKGDQSPDQWRPPNGDYWCTYARSWIEVKHAWGLTVTGEERDALREMLATC